MIMMIITLTKVPFYKYTPAYSDINSSEQFSVIIIIYCTIIRQILRREPNWIKHCVTIITRIIDILANKQFEHIINTGK